jgi:hypothetical protein
MTEATTHDEDRHYPGRCTCGYTAKDARDLREHCEEMNR